MDLQLVLAELAPMTYRSEEARAATLRIITEDAEAVLRYPYRTEAATRAALELTSVGHSINGSKWAARAEGMIKGSPDRPLAEIFQESLDAEGLCEADFRFAQCAASFLRSKWIHGAQLGEWWDAAYE